MDVDALVKRHRRGAPEQGQVSGELHNRADGPGTSCLNLKSEREKREGTEPEARSGMSALWRSTPSTRHEVGSAANSASHCSTPEVASDPVRSQGRPGLGDGGGRAPSSIAQGRQQGLFRDFQLCPRDFPGIFR